MLNVAPLFGPCIWVVMFLVVIPLTVHRFPALGVRWWVDFGAPRVIKEVRPTYTPTAKDAKIHGVVVIEAAVEADGSVGEVRVTHSLDTQHGLDDEAVKALKMWRFAPGEKAGVAVPVLVEVEMTFSIR